MALTKGHRGSQRYNVAPGSGDAWKQNNATASDDDPDLEPALGRNPGGTLERWLYSDGTLLTLICGKVVEIRNVEFMETSCGGLAQDSAPSRPTQAWRALLK